MSVLKDISYDFRLGALFAGRNKAHVRVKEN